MFMAAARVSFSNREKSLVAAERVWAAFQLPRPEA